MLTSGISITWAHHRLLEKNYSQFNYRLFLTILLGFYFSLLQGFEYSAAEFSIADSTYGSTFYMATGFHGLHVLIGTVFLIICLIRQLNLYLSHTHHFGFEAAA